MPTPVSLTKEVSPPPVKSKRSIQIKQLDQRQETATGHELQPSLAAIEAGEVTIRDHLEYFTTRLSRVLRPDTTTRFLPIEKFESLYRRNDNVAGRHFVVHQHNHPIAGVHYDLRLQISATSCVSWAIPYGLPGDPNSRRPGRLAVETRVHNLWNNLIESASHATGSLLIWDTGEYEVLPRRKAQEQAETDGSGSDDRSLSNAVDSEPYMNTLESQKLAEAFKTRYIRLRLHGSRLPRGYTVILRLTTTNNRAKQPPRPLRKRRRKSSWKPETRAALHSDDELLATTAMSSDPKDEEVMALASDNEDEMIHANNAYPGATNDVGSIHQRYWFLSLDKVNSGFVRQGGWIRQSGDYGELSGRQDSCSASPGFEPFYVLGADHERSVVTGRLSDEVLADEGVEKFQARKLWRPQLD